MKIDCHCHTIYSKHAFWGYDALNTPAEMIKAAMKRGVDGLVITDHNTVKGGLVAKKAARRFKGFVILVGSEIKTKEGEIIAIGIKEDVKPEMTIEETVEKIHDLGGIASAAHPFGSFVFRRCAGKKSLMADAIEAYNATLTKSQNRTALELATRFKKPITAGSDSHCAREVGRAGIIISGDPIEDILSRKAKVFGSHISLFEVAHRTSRKFSRSFRWRISGKRGKKF